MPLPHLLPALAFGLLWMALCRDVGYPFVVLIAGCFAIGYCIPWLLDHQMESRIADAIVCCLLSAALASVLSTIGFSFGWPIFVVAMSAIVIGAGTSCLWLTFR